jgi:hypothetical protein
MDSELKHEKFTVNFAVIGCVHVLAPLSWVEVVAGSGDVQTCELELSEKWELTNSGRGERS